MEKEKTTIENLKKYLRREKNKGVTILVDRDYSEIPDGFKMQESYAKENESENNKETCAISVYLKTDSAAHLLPDTYCVKKDRNAFDGDEAYLHTWDKKTILKCIESGDYPLADGDDAKIIIISASSFGDYERTIVVKRFIIKDVKKQIREMLEQEDGYINKLDE